AAGARRMAPESPWLRLRLLILLGATLVLGGAVACVESGMIGSGGRIEQSDFGRWQHYSVSGWTVTVFAWALRFLIGLWCIAWGGQDRVRWSGCRRLAGFRALGRDAVDGEAVWVVLGQEGTYHVVRYFESVRPRDVMPGEVAMVGRRERWRTMFGIEKYFVPEG